MTDSWTCMWVFLCATVLWVIFRGIVALTSMDTKVLWTVSAVSQADSDECQGPVCQEESHYTTLNEILNCPKKTFSSVCVTNSLLKKEHERYRKRRGKMKDLKSDDNKTEKVTRADDKLEDSAGVTTDSVHNGDLSDTGLFITYRDISGEQRQKKIQITESQCKKFAVSHRRRKKGNCSDK